MTQDDIINSWKPMVEFIAQTYGDNCEVILHDLRQLDNSIIAILNNHISGRQVGGTITDFALKIIHEKAWKSKDYIANYKAVIPGKSDNIRASTFFIKDEDGQVIAMLCMNVDLTSLSVAHNIIGKLLQVEDTHKGEDEEVLGNTSITDMLHKLITSVLKSYHRSPSRLLMDEKKDIVKKLDDKGVFLLKGAVAEVAVRLNISEQTVYRYLK